MAQLLPDGKIRKDDGSIVTPAEGGWYDARRYLGGQLLAPGEHQPGQLVSDEVIAQTNPNNVGYVQEQRDKYNGGGGQPGGGQPAPASTQPGAGVGFTAPTNRPTIDLNALYEQNYNTPEIKAATAEIDAANAELAKYQKARDDAVALEGDNPFYAEGTLTGKISKIDKKFNDDAMRIQNKIAIATNKVATLKSDAQIKTNIAMQQYNIESQEYRDQVTQLNALFQAGGLKNANASEIASYATAVGMPVALIQGVIAQQKKDEIKPQVITATDDNGNVTVAIVDANTGTTIAKNSLGKIDKSKSAGSGSTQAEQKSYYMELLRSDAARGVKLKDIFTLYTGYVDPNDIIQLYNANSMYGPAKESAEQLAKYGVKPVNTPFSINNIDTQ